MNKKAFTLAELIGIITILGIIAVLVIPIVDNTIKENKNNLYEVQINNIINGLKNWASANASILPNDNDSKISLTLGQLKQSYFLDESIINPKTKKQFPNNMVLKITNHNGGYLYEIDENTSSSDGNEYNPNAPLITLKGSIVERVNLNVAYTDLGVVAKKVSGEVIDNVSVKIMKDESVVSTVNTDTKGTYIITYSVSDNGLTTKIARTVIVEDTVSPILTVPSNISILTSEVSGFNVMMGVSATDNSGENIIVSSTGNLSAVPGVYVIIYTALDSSGNIVTKKRIVTVGNKPLYVDNSGANAPVLYNYLIPIKYDNNKWKVADPTEKWYDYDNKEWANAILVNASVRSDYVAGKDVVMNDVLGFFVWIPRYSYQLWNTANGGSNPFSIDVMFQTLNDPVALGIGNGERLTHPAFWWDENNNKIRERNEEKKGIWVAKFEASAPQTSTCYTSESASNCDVVNLNPLFKPSVKSWRYIKIANAFVASRNMQNAGNIYGIGVSDVDTHLMKNSEWGAVAYLSHSKYGQVKVIGKNNQNTYLTGCGMPLPTDSTSSTCNEYNTINGIQASTTGNVYGIYDMVGGAHEMVMGNLENSSLLFQTASSGFLSTPSIRYYDNYAYVSSSTDHSKGRLGDATRETLKTYGNSSGAWYGQLSYFPYSTTYTWIYRGGDYSITTTGLFYFYYFNGTATSNVGFRITIV